MVMVIGYESRCHIAIDLHEMRAQVGSEESGSTGVPEMRVAVVG